MAGKISEPSGGGEIVECGNLLAQCKIKNYNNEERDLYFDAIIGYIEDLIMDNDFQEMQMKFLEKYWHEFEDVDENKFIYMDIFKEYTDTIEKFIESHLVKSVQGFSMEDFLHTLMSKKNELDDELDGEIFEMLFTFTDFLQFKQMFLDYKAMKEGTLADFSGDIYVTSMGIASDEEESVL